jgi:hypothetical protein
MSLKEMLDRSVSLSIDVGIGTALGILSNEDFDSSSESPPIVRKGGAMSPEPRPFNRRAILVSKSSVLFSSSSFSFSFLVFVTEGATLLRFFSFSFSLHSLTVLSSFSGHFGGTRPAGVRSHMSDGHCGVAIGHTAGAPIGW